MCSAWPCVHGALLCIAHLHLAHHRPCPEFPDRGTRKPVAGQGQPPPPAAPGTPSKNTKPGFHACRGFVERACGCGWLQPGPARPSSPVKTPAGDYTLRPGLRPLPTAHLGSRLPSWPLHPEETQASTQSSPAFQHSAEPHRACLIPTPRPLARCAAFSCGTQVKGCPVY